MASNYPSLQILTGVGRVLWGDVAKSTTKGFKGAIKKHAEFVIGVGFPKASPATGAMLQQILDHAWNSSQQLAGAKARMQSSPVGSPAKAYAWKIYDGDAPENIQKDGWAGHWVLKCSTTLPIKCWDAKNNQLAPETVKLGYYVSLRLSVVINGNDDHTAGLFINPDHLRLEGYGPIIVPGPSGEQVFGGLGPVQLPQGASLTPVGASNVPMPGGMVPPAAPAYAPPAAPVSLAPRHDGGMTWAPPAPPAPPIPAPPAPLPAQPMIPSAEQVAAQHGVQHHAGWRFNPATRAYEEDRPPAAFAPPPAPPAPIPAPPAPAYAPPAPLPSAADWDAAHGVQHHPGYRFDPVTRQYQPDQQPVYAPPAQYTPPAPVQAGNFVLPAPVQAVPAGAIAAPAPLTSAAGYPATASPSNAPAGYPPTLAPHAGFLTPQG